MRAVTTFEREWRCAAAPAHESMSFMISPPCTFPQGFASDGSIARAMTVRDADTGRACSATARECRASVLFALVQLAIASLAQGQGPLCT